MEALLSSSGFRGLAIKEISPDLCMSIGAALSALKPGRYSIGHDVRLSSPLLAKSLAIGLNACGSDVEYFGLVPTPALAFYSQGRTGGGVVTASHNPPEYNGLKLFDSRGASISNSQYLKIISLIGQTKLADHSSLGSTRQGEGLERYVSAVASASAARKNWKVGLDPGNGATAITAAMIYKRAGVAAQAINIAPDGTFPGRSSEPSQEALHALSEMVQMKGLDIGFGFDGDGDRLAIVDERGRYISQDTALAFFLASSIRGTRGTVVVNVDTSAEVDIAVEAAGGRVVRSKVGDPYVLEEIAKRKAVAGGEACGAWISPSISLCPDGVLSSILFLNLLDSQGLRPSQIGLGSLSLSLKRQKIPCENEIKQATMRRLEESVRDRHGKAELLRVDGIRVSFSDKSWVLVRASGTEPIIRVTVESKSESQTQKLMTEFMKLVSKAKECKK